MRLVYGDDASLVTSDIRDALTYFGYWEGSESVLEVLASLEGQLPQFDSLAYELISREQIEPALRFFFFDPRTESSLSSFGEDLLSRWLEGAASREEVNRSIVEAAYGIQQQDFNCSTPLNVVAGLAVLFRLVVLPRRNFEEADVRFRKILGAQLHVVDEAGQTVYGPKEHEAAASEEYSFWRFYDVALREFDLSKLPSEPAPEGTLPATSPQELVDFYAQRIAGVMINHMALDRRQ